MRVATMKYRRVEYYSASVMVGWSAILALPGNTITERDAFSSFLERGWTEVQLAVMLGIGGALWLGALWVNGHHRRTPVVRCLGAFLGVTLWSHVTFLLITHGLETGAWPTGIAAYGILAFFDLLSCYRSASDAYDAHVRGKVLDRLASGADDA